MYLNIFKAICAVTLAACSSASAFAQHPTVTDRTLRVDYQFTGNAKEQGISLAKVSSFKGWAGRRVHTDSLLLQGNGDIVMRSAQDHSVLFCQSFSTLFQEWLTTEEAVRLTRSFENTCLLPMPSEPAEITVRLFDMTRKDTVSFTHLVDPKDILIRNLDGAEVPPYRFLHESGPADEKIDVAIVAEGYTSDETALFYTDAQSAVESILSYAPFSEYADRFNFVAVAAPSRDSGVSVPHEGIWKNTALNSHFSTFYSERYLTTLNLFNLHDLLCGIPYEHIIILANTDTYGGGGIYNSYMLTTAHHTAFKPVAVHEFGHSFAGLADEYYYDDQYENCYSPEVEPWEPNLTTLKDFDLKWKDLLPSGTPVPTEPTAANAREVGVYEGGGYMSKGVFRAFQDCRMKTNEYPTFCPVCQRAIARIIEYQTAR